MNVCLIASASLLPSYVSSLLMWLHSRETHSTPLTISGILIRVKPSKSEAFSACSNNLKVSLEGDIINYQLRIFPSKQIKQNRKLTEQTNAVNLSCILCRKKIVNINCDSRYPRDIRHKTRDRKRKITEVKLLSPLVRSTKNNKFSCCQYILLCVSTWTLFMNLFFAQKLKFRWKSHWKFIPCDVFLWFSTKIFDKRWISLITSDYFHKSSSELDTRFTINEEQTQRVWVSSKCEKESMGKGREIATNQT